MTDDDALRAARDDLAFMRGVVRSSPEAEIATGEAFVAAGVIYGLQCVFHWGQVAGWAPESGPVALGVIIAFSALFAAVMIWLSRKNAARVRSRGAGQGSASRTGGAVFGALGMTNFVILTTIGIVAWREQSLAIWLLYPTVVIALQGSGWLAYFMLRRQGWMLTVAAAYYVSAIAMSLLGGVAFILVIGFALLVIMTGSGLMLIRQARRSV